MILSFNEDRIESYAGDDPDKNFERQLAISERNRLKEKFTRYQRSHEITLEYLKSSSKENFL